MPDNTRATDHRCELIVSYRERISELHSQCIAADKAVRDALANKIERTRQTGETIKAAKGDLGAREFAEATDFLSSDAVRAYLKLVRLHPEPVSDLETGLRVVRESMQVTGALEFPSGHGAQQLHQPNFFSTAIRYVQILVADFRKFCRRHALRDWNTHELNAFLASLKPIVDVYREANLELKSRS